MHVHDMIASHPHVKGSTNDALISAIEHAMECAQTCHACADACLGEAEVARLTQCIRLNMDCADLCTAVVAVGSRRTGSNENVIQAALAACGLACKLCGEECRKHAGHHEHCRICAEACEQCAAACREATASIH